MRGAPDRHAIALVQAGSAPGRRSAPQASAPRSSVTTIVARIADGDRPVGERMRRDRHQQERRHLRVDDRTLRGEGVRGRARRRGDDEAVGAHRVDEAAVDVDGAVDHPSRRAAIDDDVVEREHRPLGAAVGAVDGRLEKCAPLLDITAGEHCGKRVLHVGERHVGQEAEPTLVDTDEGDIERRELAGNRQHRAVAAEDDRHVGLACPAFPPQRSDSRAVGCCAPFRPRGRLCGRAGKERPRAGTAARRSPDLQSARSAQRDGTGRRREARAWAGLKHTWGNA